MIDLVAAILILAGTFINESRTRWGAALAVLGLVVLWWGQLCTSPQHYYTVCGIVGVINTYVLFRRPCQCKHKKRRPII